MTWSVARGKRASKEVDMDNCEKDSGTCGSFKNFGGKLDIDRDRHANKNSVHGRSSTGRIK